MMEMATDPDAVKATTAIIATRTFIPGQRKYAVMDRMTTATGKLMRDAVFAPVNIRISAAAPATPAGRTRRGAIRPSTVGEDGKHATIPDMMKSVLTIS
jgi:hypothetical protein